MKKNILFKGMSQILILPAIMLMMGNQKSCQQQAVVQPRQLKKIVGLEKITSKPVNLGAAGSFDFEFVVNQQIYTVLQETDKFTFRIQAPVSSPSTVSVLGANQKITQVPVAGGLNFSEKSQYFINQWVTQARETSSKPVFVANESKEAWCMVNDPQVKINGAVNSFELIGGGGLSLGFTPTGDKNVSLNAASFNVDVFQLDLSLQGYNPRSRTVLGSSNVTSNQTKTKVSFGLNLGSFTLGPSFYYSLPLSKVTKNALNKAVDGLSAGLDQVPWYTRVLANKDEEVIIVGGTNVNLKVGDVVSIWNAVYNWDGEPCNSNLLYDGIAKTPIAKGVVNWVDSELSVVSFTEPPPDYENVQIGARVRLEQRVEDIATKQASASGNTQK